MKNFIKHHPWHIIEEGFDPSLNKISESIFSLGNGKMGQRGNFEETYTGETLKGNYIAGVYYPDKTRVGWWKNGYPEYFAKVLNAANWMKLNIKINGETLDLHQVTILDFKRKLDMQKGILTRTCVVELTNGNRVRVESVRFYSLADDEAAFLQYKLVPENFDGKIEIESILDGDVHNEDANYGDYFWNVIEKFQDDKLARLTLETKKTNFWVSTATTTLVYDHSGNLVEQFKISESERSLHKNFVLEAHENQEICIIKYAVNLSSENHKKSEISSAAAKMLEGLLQKPFQLLLEEQEIAWAQVWEKADVIIEGDVAAQQAIRYAIYQLHQTYTGKDARLNIGPKGFTGEKYGGSTYWDTEAYCLPFYLATDEPQVAKNLLIYRYKHLQKAIENAEKLGFKHGAALFPMVTMNGEECHNEWEITFEEIHRNGAIAYAIFNYIRYTGDESYLANYGLEVLIGIARFWSQRVNWSEEKQKFVILGVTGPNEYENNINNNWYTNTIAVWCLNYTKEAISQVESAHSDQLQSIFNKLEFDRQEINHWDEIVKNMYFPVDENLGIFLQQEGYLDKEQILVCDLPASERPLNQKWSWDRILRSCFIKQADVLQGMYFFEDSFSVAELQRNFDFYESRTVHESSLSPCVHAILAAKLGDLERACRFYLRTARLDLDDYNNDTEDGLHITSMAGTWLSIVEGFGGMRVRNDCLYLNPQLPKQWKSYAFKVNFRGCLIHVEVSDAKVKVTPSNAVNVDLNVFGNRLSLLDGKAIEVQRA